MKALILALILFPALAFAQKHEHGKTHKHDHKHEHKEVAKTPQAPAAPVTSPTKAVVSVNGMVCAFCAQGLEKTFKEQKEVDQISVDLESKKVVVGFKKGQQLDDEKIKTLIKEAGYDVVSITKE